MSRQGKVRIGKNKNKKINEDSAKINKAADSVTRAVTQGPLTSTERAARSSRSRKLNLLPGTPYQLFCLCYKLVKILVAQLLNL